MPYFKCPRCECRAYSAAAESRCPVCHTPLHRKHQLAKSVPPTGRFVPVDLTMPGLGGTELTLPPS